MWQASYRHAIKQPASSKKAAKRKQRRETKSQPRKKDKYFILSLFIMIEVSASFSVDLANDFPEAEESQIWHKEPTPKNIQAERRQSNNEMMEMLKYMKSEIAFLKTKQEALEFANPPRLRKFSRLLYLTNNDVESAKPDLRTYIQNLNQSKEVISR